MAGKKKNTKEKSSVTKGKKTDSDSGISRAGKLGAVAVQAKKQYGHSVLRGASEEEILIVPRVSTGLFSLDLRTNGGWPLRRIAMAYGMESSCKTSSFLRGLGNAQRLCGNCSRPAIYEKGKMELPDLENGGEKIVDTYVIKECSCGNPRDYISLWIDAEGVWEPSWSKRMGVWPEKVLLMRPGYGEQAYDIVVNLIATGELDHVVIDSLAAMAPLAEKTNSTEQQHQGVSARMNNKFLRKMVSEMNTCFSAYNRIPTLWLINQLRQKIGVMFGPSETVPGGFGQKFATSLEVEFKKKKVNVDDEGDAIDGEFSFVVKKNKVGTEGGKGEFRMCKMDTDYLKVGDLMEHDSVINTAVKMGLIDKPNNVMYEFDGEKYRGMGQMELFFIEHPERYEALKTEMLKYFLGIA